VFYNQLNGVNVRQYLHKLPRFTGLVFLTLVLLGFIVYLKPQLIGEDIHKMSLYLLGSLGGFWVDWRALPYARPDSYLVAFDWRKVRKLANAADFAITPGYELVFALCCLRRCFSMGFGALVLGMAL